MGEAVLFASLDFPLGEVSATTFLECISLELVTMGVSIVMLLGVFSVVVGRPCIVRNKLFSVDEHVSSHILFIFI